MLIIHANIISMADRNIQNGYILVEGGKIKELGPMEECPGYESINNGTIIDAIGRFVLPGLVDAHSHIGLYEDSVGFEGDDANEVSEPITPQLRAIDGIYHADRSFHEAKQWGVTTAVVGPGSANVIGGQFAAMKTHGRTVDEMVFKAPCAMKVSFGENPKFVHHEKNHSPGTRMATAAMLREQLFKAREYKEALEEYEADKEEKDKPEFDIRLEALISILKRDIVVKAHAHRADDILTALRIAKEFDLDMTIEHCTEGWLIADVLKERQIDVILGPILTDRSKIELRNQNIEAPGLLAKSGVRVAIMSDHPEFPIQHLLLCAAVAVREGMPEEEALKAITINAAIACRIENRVGSLEAGKDADIVIFSGHPLDYHTKVDMTLIDGNIVFERQ